MFCASVNRLRFDYDKERVQLQFDCNWTSKVKLLKETIVIIFVDAHQNNCVHICRLYLFSTFSAILFSVWVRLSISAESSSLTAHQQKTRKPSYRWQTRATRKPAKNCSNSTCLQRCRWQYWPICIRLAVVAPEICEIPRNLLKIQTYGVQGHPRSSIFVSIESPCTTSY